MILITAVSHIVLFRWTQIIKVYTRITICDINEYIPQSGTIKQLCGSIKFVANRNGHDLGCGALYEAICAALLPIPQPAGPLTTCCTPPGSAFSGNTPETKPSLLCLLRLPTTPNKEAGHGYSLCSQWVVGWWRRLGRTSWGPSWTESPQKKDPDVTQCIDCALRGRGEQLKLCLSLVANSCLPTCYEGIALISSEEITVGGIASPIS